MRIVRVSESELIWVYFPPSHKHRPPKGRAPASHFLRKASCSRQPLLSGGAPGERGGQGLPESYFPIIDF